MIEPGKEIIVNPVPQLSGSSNHQVSRTIVSKVSTRRDLRDFVSLPYNIMAKDVFWVPPLRYDVMRRLNPKRNPFFQHANVELLIGRQDKTPVARAAVFVDRNYERVHGEKDLQFGWFDCINCQETISSLANAMFDAAYRHGKSRIVGPYTFSINEEAGLLVEGFEIRPSIMTPYNPPWYPDLLEGAGFRKVQDLFAYLWSAEKGVPKKLKRVSERALSRPGTKIEHFALDNFDEEIRSLHKIYNDAFEGTWGYVPLTSMEFRKMGEDLRKLVEPSLTFIVRINGESAGFGLLLPDWNQALVMAHGRRFPFGLIRILIARRRINCVRFIVLAVSKRFRGRGLEAAIIHRMFEKVKVLGYRKAELSMVLESNRPMRRIIEGTIGSPVYKRYRVYEKWVH
jgi:GNAT superfamily N-acetyltransferase